MGYPTDQDFEEARHQLPERTTEARSQGVSEEGRLLGFMCATPGHENEGCNQHGGWHNALDQFEAIVEHVKAGCDIVLIVDTKATAKLPECCPDFQPAYEETV